MSKLWGSTISGIGVAITGIIMPLYIEFIKPYAGYILAFGLFLSIAPWVLVLINFFRNNKSLERCNSDKRIREYILRLKALKENIAQLQNPPSEFRPKVPKNSNALLGNMLTVTKRKRYNEDAIENISLKYNSIKEGIKKDYHRVFKGLPKNTTYDIMIYDIEYLLSIFKSMQRPKE